jgi:predicted ribosome quality control (RQC) complex YloA/Tae2 family protein
MTYAANRALQGRRVDEVRLVDPAGLALIFDRGAPPLVLAIHPRLHGLFMADRETLGTKPATGQAAPFRQALRGTVLGRAEIDGTERVVRIPLGRRSATGAMRGWSLVLEAMGRWSNLYLVGPDGRMVTGLKKLSGGRSEMSAGSPYVPPPADPGQQAPDRDEVARRIRTGETAPIGMSKGTRGDLLEHASAADAAARFLDMVADPPGSGSLRHDAAGWPRLSPVPADDPGAVNGPLPGLSAVCWREASDTLRSQEIRRTLSALFGRRRERLAGTVAKVERELAETADADEYRRRGTAILSHLGAIPPGAGAFTPDPGYGGGEVPLDPHLPPTAVAQRYFSMARRLDSRREHAGSHLARLQADLDAIDALAAEAATLRDPDELERLALRLPPVDRPQRRDDEAARHDKPPERFRRYQLASGHQVLVGRDAASNDHLLTRQAAPHDIWCHAEGFPGSHVILKLPDRSTPPNGEVIREACMLAALHSQAAGQGSVAVTYTRRRDVRKPKGAAPGLVILGSRKTMLVPPALPPGAILRR